MRRIFYPEKNHPFLENNEDKGESTPLLKGQEFSFSVRSQEREKTPSYISSTRNRTPPSLLSPQSLLRRITEVSFLELEKDMGHQNTRSPQSHFMKHIIPNQEIKFLSEEKCEKCIKIEHANDILRKKQRKTCIPPPKGSHLQDSKTFQEKEKDLLISFHNEDDLCPIAKSTEKTISKNQDILNKKTVKRGILKLEALARFFDNIIKTDDLKEESYLTPSTFIQRWHSKTQKLF